MNDTEQRIAEFAKKLVADVKASSLPHADAAVAFGLAAKMLAVEECVEVPFDDCAGWAKKRLNDGFAWDVVNSEDTQQPIIKPVAPALTIIVG